MPIPDFLNFNNAGPQQRPADGDTRPDFVDQDAMSARLAERAADWVPMLFPNGRRDDDRHWRVANIRGDRPKKSGSCVIFMHGDYAGGWRDHDGGGYGGPLSTIAERLGLSGAELFAKARELVGMPSSAPVRSATKPKADYSTEIAHILRHATPIAGSLAQTYLEARRLTIPIDSPDLLFNPNVTHWERKTGEPCLVARFRYPGGNETGGLHRIYIKDDGSWHAGKKALGVMDGAVVMLSPVASRMGVGEGIESTAAGMQLFDLPGWATASADNMRKLGDFITHYGAGIIRELVIFADRGKAGQDAALYLARAAQSVGIVVTIRLPIGDDDFADDLLNGRGRSEQTLPIDDDPEPEPQSEIIEPSSYSDVLAAIAKVTKGDYSTATRALELLSRCVDTDPMKDADALNRIKAVSSYNIAALRSVLAQLRERHTPQNAELEQVSTKPWRPYLVYRDAENLKPTGGMHNVGAVLKYGEQFQHGDKSIFGFNEFSLNVVTYGPLPWDRKIYLDSDFPRNLEHRDILGVVDFCQSYDIPTNKDAAGDALLALASLQTFHPVRDFFDECHKQWDRVKRLDKLLTEYCGVENTELARACGARWMIGAVARIYDPGCQMDTALILEGDQGIRKSSFFRILAQDRPWFVDQLSDMGGKDSLIETAGALVIELAELDAMRRADVSRIKKYLAFRSDRYRPPWERLVVDVPRQCVFAGTINPDGNPYLNDTTGGRRFWCFASPAIDIEAVKRDVRHLWGEAVERYRSGKEWWLHEDHLVNEAKEQVRQRTDFKINEAWEKPIIEWLRRNPGSVTIEDVLRSALNFEQRALHTKAAQMDVAAILKVNGYKRNTSVRPQTWSLPQPQPLWQQPREREPGEEG